MAGMGKRLRPITLETPKPLVKIAGKSIVHWLIKTISDSIDENITDIAFVIGHFPIDVTDYLNNLAKSFNAKCHIFIQDKPLGTAHAIYSAKSLLNGKVIVAFGDTIIDTNRKFIPTTDVVIWTKYVDDPSAYGVVVKNNQNFIREFVEKPSTPISNEAIIGIYYFKEAGFLKEKIDILIQNNITHSGEYQLTDALQALLNDKFSFSSYDVESWLDTGNHQLLINSSKYILQNFVKDNNPKIKNCIIKEPVYIGENVSIKDSIIGPNVSIEDNVLIENSVCSNTLIYNNSVLRDCIIDNSVIGSNSEVFSKNKNLVIGSFNKIQI